MPFMPPPPSCAARRFHDAGRTTRKLIGRAVARGVDRRERRRRRGNARAPCRWPRPTRRCKRDASHRLADLRRRNRRHERAAPCSPLRSPCGSRSSPARDIVVTRASVVTRVARRPHMIGLLVTIQAPRTEANTRQRGAWHDCTCAAVSHVRASIENQSLVQVGDSTRPDRGRCRDADRVKPWNAGPGEPGSSQTQEFPGGCGESSSSVLLPHRCAVVVRSQRENGGQPI